MQENEADREARLRELASKLFFTLTAESSRFALYRDVDISKPVRHDGSRSTRRKRYSTHGSCAARTAADAGRANNTRRDLAIPIARTMCGLDALVVTLPCPLPVKGGKRNERAVTCYKRTAPTPGRRYDDV